MPLNIPTLAANAVDTAWSLGSSALTAATLRTGPTATHDITDDLEEIEWDSETELDVLLYSAKQVEGEDDERSTPAIGWTAKALVRVADLSGADTPTRESRLTAGDDTWEVTDVEKVPTNPILILTLRR